MPIADLARIHRIRHAEGALDHLAEVAGHLLDGAPALVPAFALEDGLDRQMRGAGARRRGDRDVVEIDGLGEIGPFLRLGQAVRACA